jgi:hypothetical protein
MKENVNRQSCGREDDLIAFLYSELREDEAQIFRMHMQDCSSCKGQFSSFTNIRESVVAWRDDSLGGFRVADARDAMLDRKGPSAIAALRGFFNLSPLWLKGAVAFASILFCIFTVLAIARLRETPPEVMSSRQPQVSEREINALIEQRVQDELRRSRESQEATITAGMVNITPSDQMSGSRTPHSVKRQSANAPRHNARRPLTKVEREELAADLRLAPGTNTSELELLDDRINQ